MLGVVLMRKDAIARFALAQADTPRAGLPSRGEAAPRRA